ncbi:hypothetical protein FQN52_007770 [Onygenales sp. PD_12]|nr:hypothetical protein FQN52_007770 [Onygenales sp. PD_12]
MTSTDTPDPYLALGIAKDADTAAIRSAYKKLVLKCHPDKIKDEAERSRGQDEFQKVQQAYELLSDEKKRAKYDELQELKESLGRDAGAGPSSYHRPSAFARSYEYREGAYYEERAPKERFFDDEVPFSEEPRSTSRKHDGYERKQAPEEKEKKKSRHADAPEPVRSSKERMRDARDAVRSSRSDRAKNRDKERKKDREYVDRHTRTFVVSEGEEEHDSDTPVYSSLPTESRSYEERPRKSKSGSKGSESRRRRERTAEYPEEWSSPKLDNAREYIQKSKSSYHSESERRPSSSWPSTSAYYDQDTTYFDTARRSSGRSRTKDSSRPNSSGGRERERKGSADLDPPLRPSVSPRIPSMPTASSAPANIKNLVTGFMRGSVPRSASSLHPHDKPRPPPTRRSDSLPLSGLSSRRTDPLPARPSKLKENIYDSGYSSPGTPDMHHGTSPPKSSRYIVVEEDEDHAEYRTVRIDPSASYSHSRSISPARCPPITVHTPQMPTRSRTYNYPTDGAYDSTRPSTLRTSPHSSRDHLFGEVKPKFKYSNVSYAQTIRQEDINYGYNSSRKGSLDPNAYRDPYSRPPHRKDSVAC